MRTIEGMEAAVVSESSGTDDLLSVTIRKTVLIVEDEEIVRRLASRMLATLGYRVLEARDGQEAMGVLRRAAHDVNAVLTDVAMPGIGGAKLGETIAQCWPRIPVLYMSGFPAQRMADKGVLDPNKPFLQKPFTSEQLGRKLRELLGDRPGSEAQ